ncbi:response regulator transcription factor [Microbispora sp. RL4-1S]|uniref:Response regulator transcription factor n=1 Tax=Microbispora oryzae TaxID=2806554 RepID=A0A940WM45_9ACTN|nr:response regulator transcription factor [Microbispora oryzae]MBP2705513.1 response regulator transcription factor [Microbispora oryzae]
MCDVTFRREDFVTRTRRRPLTTVLLVDHDPISRHVLESTLREAPHIRLVAGVDGRSPVDGWPLTGVDTVVLAAEVTERLLDVIRDLASRRLRVLVVSVGWTRRTLNDALVAGVGGCLVKDAQGRGVSSAVHAMSAGHLVLSPMLWQLIDPPGRTGQAPGCLADVRGDRRTAPAVLRTLTEREREVLTLLSAGLSTAEAADSLKVTPATIKSHVSHIMTKFGVRSRLEAVLMMRNALATSCSRSGSAA